MAIRTCISLLLVAAAAVLADPESNSSATLNWQTYKPADVIVEPVEPIKGISTRIVGGSAAFRGQFPWQAALFIDGRSFCGGSLISSNVVLTAAHCTIGARSVTVYLGAVDVSQAFDSARQVFQSASIHNHPQYSSLNRNIDYDIAIIRLSSSAKYNSYVSPVRLASALSGPFVGVRARSSGWGKISDASQSISPTLNWVNLNIISNTDCKRTFGTAINDAKICVSTIGGTSTCNGDSGGPLVYQEVDGRYTLIGVTSFGSGRGCSVGAPAVFTRVSSYTNNYINKFL